MLFWKDNGKCKKADKRTTDKRRNQLVPEANYHTTK